MKWLRDASPMTLARIAGVLYLIIIILGLGNELFIRGDLISDNPLKNAQNILGSVGLFRFGFAADAIMLLCDVALAIVLLVLLQPVSKILSLSAAVFRLTQAAILGFNLLLYYAAILMLNGTHYTGIGSEQKQSFALFFLDLHSHGYDLGLLFFGVSTLIVGYLVIRATFFPTFLGYLIMAAGVTYLIGSMTRFVAPEINALIQPIYLVAIVGEGAFCLWLLIRGAQPTFRSKRKTRAQKKKRWI